MTKDFALLLLFSLFSVYAWAQTPAPEIKISGGIKTGLFYSTSSIGSDAGRIRLYKHDETTYVGVQAYIGAEYDAGLYGFKTTLRVDYNPDPVPVPSLAEGYGWVAPLDGQLTMKIGAVTETTFSTGGAENFLSFDVSLHPQAYYGTTLVVSPKNTGLSFGVLLPVDVSALPNNAGQVLSGTTIAARYVIEKILDVIVGYAFADTTFYSYPGSWFGLKAISYGFDLLAFQNFSFNAEGYAPLNNGANITLDEKIGVKIGKLAVSLRSYQFIRNGDTTQLFFKPGGDTADVYATFKPYIYYDFNGVMPGVFLFWDTANGGTWAINPVLKFALGDGNFEIGASIGTNYSRNKFNNVDPTKLGASIYSGLTILL